MACQNSINSSSSLRPIALLSKSPFFKSMKHLTERLNGAACWLDRIMTVAGQPGSKPAPSTFCGKATSVAGSHPITNTFGASWLALAMVFATALPQSAQAQGPLIYRTSIDPGSNPFLIYNVANNVWTSLGNVATGSSFAVSQNGDLFMLNDSTNVIQKYVPTSNTWLNILAGPPSGGSAYGNLEVTNTGEFLFTKSGSNQLWHNSGGSWSAVTLPGSASALGDYEPSSGTYAVSANGSEVVWKIALPSFSISTFSNGANPSTGETRRFGEIYNGEWYTEYGYDPIRKVNLSSSANAYVTTPGASPGFYASAAVDETAGVFYVNPFAETTFKKWSPVTGAYVTLASAPSADGHNTMAFVNPGITTLAATSVTTTSATLNGTANPQGLATTAWFQWGTDPALSGATSTTAVSVGSGTSNVAISTALTGLVANTTYYFRAMLNNSSGTLPGGVLSFVTGPEITVEYPSGTALVDGGATINLGGVLTGAPSSVHTFTVRNVGSFNLTGIGVTVDGTNAGSFSVSAPGSATLVPGASTTFTVQLPSPPEGAISAALHISSNDANENPFDIPLTATGITDTPAYTFTNSTSAGGYSLFTFGSEFTVNTACTITALGFYDHNQDGISGNNPVGLWNSSGTLLASTVVSNADPLRGVFRYRYLPAPVLLTVGQIYRVGALTNGVDPSGFDGPGFTVDSRITFNGQRYDNQAGTLTFPTNNNGTSPGIWGAGMLLGAAGPEISVEQPGGTNIADGATTNFGTIPVGSSSSLTFTIRNTGTANLTGLTITKDGTNQSEFTVTANPTAPVSGPSGTTTFTVRFAPSGGGTRTAAIHIANNDSNENPFDINLTGTGNTPPTFSGYTVATPYQTAATISLGKLMRNAADTDGDAVSATSAGPSSTAGGSAVLQGTSILYTPPNGFAGTDTFPVIITDARGASVVGTVTLTVQPNTNVGSNPPVLTPLSGNRMGLDFYGIPGRPYEVQRSTDMAIWQVLTTVNAAANGAVTFIDESPPPGSAFYRLRKP